jgi:hypothetical protein
MRTPLAAAIGVLVVAGVVAGVSATRSASEGPVPVQPIRVEAPAGVVAPVPAAPPDPDGYVAPPPADDDDDDDDDGPDDD